MNDFLLILDIVPQNKHKIKGLYKFFCGSMKKRSPAGGLFSDSLCSAAAAAEYDDECKNDDQGAVIVEKMAKTVVHSSPPKDGRNKSADSIHSHESGKTCALH